MTSLTARLAAKWQLGLGFRESAAGLTARLQDRNGAAFLIASAFGEHG